jgi:uncharacterized protein YegL
MRKATVLLFLALFISVTYAGISQVRDFSISGRITCEGTGLSGVYVQLTGASSAIGKTDQNGSYAFTGLRNGTYKIDPVRTGYSFTPLDRSVAVSNRSVTNQDFIATKGGPGPTPGPTPPTSQTSLTATVLVMDVSGSMAWRWKGGIKIDSAKKAALQFIEEVANEPRLPGISHRIGVVIFSATGSLVLPLTEDYAHAKQAIIKLGAVSSTNLGAGLVTALQELDTVPTAKRFVILLSDGKTNTGLSRQQILSGPVVEARQKRVCIHTVAFGDPGHIDEDFLRKIAAGSGCGSYNYAASGFHLFGTYVKIRHAMLGSNRIVEFTSETARGSRVYVLPGQAIALGAFQLTGPARELHYTLAWSEPGRMRAKLVDPDGSEVTYTYPSATVYSGSGFSHVTVFSPKQGIWRIAAVGGTTFPRGIEYYGVASARTGGFVIPYRIPKICIFDDICFPIPDLPTTLIVAISVVSLAVLLYQQFIVK